MSVLACFIVGHLFYVKVAVQFARELFDAAFCGRQACSAVLDQSYAFLEQAEAFLEREFACLQLLDDGFKLVERAFK